MAKLYVVPTPVGNLEDMTFRAISVLREVDCILAEDTRTSGILLKHFDIHTRMQSHHKFNEHQTIEGIVTRIEGGENIALISDAGTPAISDPGFLLVRECRRRDVTVECLPGATAFVPALVASGLPNEKFCFEGFLPQKKGRATRLTELAEEPRTIVFYESPFRLLKTLIQFKETFGGERAASVSREISKIHEETVRGTIDESICYLNIPEKQKEFDKIAQAYEQVQETGYGIVMPTIDELTLDEPQIIKQSGKYGIKLRASAPSIHMMKIFTQTEVTPIVGSEQQSEELVSYLLREFDENPEKIWESNIFGKSVHELVNEGLHNKLYRMPADARRRIGETVEKIINDGCNGLICLIL